jgi:hypothetical protein
MDDEKPGFEENLSRLMHAGLPPDARPGAETRAEVFRRLVEITRARADSRSFPDHLVVAIAAAIVLVAAWLVGRMAGQGLPAAGLAATAFVLIVVLNLAMVPLAGVVIVLRRRHV